MPKRVPTPPPPDDEPRYLAVIQPYPLNAHWELPQDIMDFARWISCCIPTNPFYAFFYKPSARAMVILEIERSFNGFHLLLGEHSWKAFLNNPTDEEQGRVSQIFYCLYKTGREAQKDGWKRINVLDHWFTSWSPEDKARTFTSPYPKPVWCEPPPEDRTNKPLCRPLPRHNAPPPPPKSNPPVVGSPQWVGARTTDVSSVLVGHPARTTRGRGSLTITTRGGKTLASSRNSPQLGAAKSPSSAWSKGAPSTGSTTTPTPQSSTWTPLTESSTSPASSVAPHPVQSACPPGDTAASATANNPAPAPAPPATARRWADEGEDDEDDEWWKDPPLGGGGGGESADPSSSSAAAAPTVVPNRGPKYWLNRDAIEQQVAEAMDRLAVDTTVDPALTYAADWEQKRVEIEAGCEAEEENGSVAAAVDESLWDEEPVLKLGPPKPLCSAHGRICNKGICMEYSRQLREQKREEERKAREDAILAKKNKKKKGKGDGTDGGSVCGTSTCNGSQPARSVAGSSSSKTQGLDDGASSVGSWRRGDVTSRRGDIKSPQDDDNNRNVVTNKWRGRAESLATTRTESVAGSDRSRPW